MNCEVIKFPEPVSNRCASAGLNGWRVSARPRLKPSP